MVILPLLVNNIAVKRSRLLPEAYLPVGQFSRFRYPGRHRKAKVASQGIDMGLIRLTEALKSALCLTIVRQFQTGGFKHRPEPCKALITQPVVFIFFGRSIKNRRKVHDSMARHGKGQFRLSRAYTLDTGQHKGRSIKHRGKSCQPRLVIVLGAIVGENRVGEMALEQLGRPLLPLG